MSQREMGMGEHDAQKWGRASTRLRGITFQKTFDYGQCCGNIKFKKKFHYSYIKVEFIATMDQRNCVETNKKYAIIFMITKTVSID
jgi:hypothetical protein